MFIYSAESSIIPFMFGKIINCLEGDSRNFLKSYILLYIISWIAIHVCSRIGEFIAAFLFPKLTEEFTTKLFEIIESNPISFFKNNMTGNILNNLCLFGEKLVGIFDFFIEYISPSFIAICISLILFSKIKIIFALIFGIWLFVHMWLCFKMGKKCIIYSMKCTQQDSTLKGCVSDILVNYFAWQLFDTKKVEYNIVKQFQDLKVKATTHAQIHIVKLRCFLFASIALFNISGIYLFKYYWKLNEINLGEMIFIINVVLNIEMLAWFIGLRLPEIFMGLGACKHAFDMLLDYRPKEREAAKQLVISSGDIYLKNVDFVYGDMKIFNNLSLHIKAGEKVGVVGRSGCGKTTLCNLILGLYHLENGDIFIDNQSIKDSSSKSIREAISVVPQDPILFGRTIRENILYGSKILLNSQIQSVIEKIDLVDLIREKGWEFNVGEGGNLLSKGQRQKIAIARAILRNTPILFMDEATSALDITSEAIILKNLEDLTKDKTVIVIAHRLSVLRNMDSILVIESHNKCKKITYEELIKQSSMYFK